MPIALFILGHAGSGKTKLAKRWVRSRVKKGESWALLDKDICGEGLANALMRVLKLNPDDRDSPQYKAHVRDLEYQGCLDIARDQLKLGVNVALPGPWSHEVSNGRVFDVAALGFPKGVVLRHVYLDATGAEIKARILERENPRDAWKIEHWKDFEKTLGVPAALEERGVLRVPARLDAAEMELMLAQEVFKSERRTDK